MSRKRSATKAEYYNNGRNKSLESSQESDGVKCKFQSSGDLQDKMNNLNINDEHRPQRKRVRSSDPALPSEEEIYASEDAKADIITKLVDADFLDDEDLEKKVLPYIIKHSTRPDQHEAAAPAYDSQEGVGKMDVGKMDVESFLPSAAVADAQCYDSDKADDAAWFQLFGLLEKYGSEGMLEKAFATPPPSMETGEQI